MEALFAAGSSTSFCDWGIDIAATRALNYAFRGTPIQR
jgi:hypothetical protein